MHCNGNGACFNFEVNEAMCPTYKASCDRLQSPKGRASLIKEWLRRENQNEQTDAFNKQVYQVLRSCAACKSCSGQCPVKVDIPDARQGF